MIRTFNISARNLSNLLAAILLIAPVISFALDTQREDISAFVDELVNQHDFEREWLEQTLSDGETKQKILDAISRPAEKTLAWHEYRKIFVTPKRINAGVKFWQENEERLARISADTGVPAEIMVAIIGVETY